MSAHLLRDLESLKKYILRMGFLVEEATNKAILALVDRRPELAQEVIQGDGEIDRKEREIDEECLKTLALHQPVAADLRFIIAIMKVNNELEQMGDKAVSIAKDAIGLTESEPLRAKLDFPRMCQLVRSAVRRTIDALIHMDVNLARQVLEEDAQIDEARDSMTEILRETMQADSSSVGRAMAMLACVRRLERIADMASNICVDLIFTVEGANTKRAEYDPGE
ncbi:MAG: hypothetical protein BWZ10_01694 [candidate division BRC1 bacterium ADurb.BinA364]|nr:MAG: hypothetical protein BWZ10_01694 [candidate division BRC1 bacterium ADurb.BinA364]